MIPSTVVGITILAFGGLIALGNFYLSFLRIPLYRSMGRKVKWVSGFPIVGFVATVLGVALLGFSLPSLCLGAATLLVDTCGPLWFVVALLRQPSKRRGA